MILPPRHPLSRARLFLNKAAACPVEHRDDCEAFLEAAIVFARAALHRFQAEYKKHPEWKRWWQSLKSDPAIQFFRVERDQILKVAPPPIGQVVRLGRREDMRAADLYYYESPDIPATQTICRHLEAFAVTLREAELRFSSGTVDAI